MKNILKKLLVTGGLMVATTAGTIGSAKADPMIDLTPYLGVDFHQAWMSSRIFYRDLFPSSYPGFSLYAGTRVNRFFAFEFGYDWSLKKSKTWTVTQGQQFFDSKATATFTGTTKIRRSGGHIDVLGILPMFCGLELFGLLGYGLVQSQIEMVNMSVAPNWTIPDSSAIATLSASGRSVLRVGVGANYMITELLGVRGKLGWESTTMLRLEGNGYFKELGYGTRGFKGSMTAALGAFYKF